MATVVPEFALSAAKGTSAIGKALKFAHAIWVSKIRSLSASFDTNGVSPQN